MRRNNSIIKFLGCFALVAGLVSCEDDDTNFVSNADSKPVVTLAGPATYTVDENASVPLTFTLNKASAQPIQVKIDVVDENDMPVDASEFHDFAFDGDLVDYAAGFGVGGYVITIPANTTTFTFNFTPTLDDEAEGSETFRFRMSVVGNLVGRMDATTEFFDVTINNAGQNEITLVFDWDATFNIGGTDYSLCEEGYDIDILVYDENMDPFGSGAQTAACPEELVMNFEDYPDGTYHITGYLYDEVGVSGAGISPAQDFPVRIHYTRGGSTTLGEGTFTQTDAFDSDSTDDTELYLVTVVIANGVVTLVDNGTTIVSGRQSHAAKTNR